MLKILLKKQMLELNKSFFFDQKKGKARSKAARIALILLYVLLMVGVIGGMFGVLAAVICGPLEAVGMSWFYFAIFTIMALALGVFGSVFNTFSGLYQAKDNNLLLSMPIPVRSILAARLTGVYLMGLMFSAVVLLPALIVYYAAGRFSVRILIGTLLLLVIVSVLVLVLSCVFGWAVAKISQKLKNRSFVTVLISLIFFAGYYLLCFRANEILADLVANAEEIGSSLRGAAYPLYLLGMAGTGDPGAVLIMAAASAALLAVVFYVLSRSFIRIATAKTAGARRVYREKSTKCRTVSGAMRAKEFARFFASPNYMLNCGLGVILLPIAGILMLVKGPDVLDLLYSVFESGSNTAPILFGAAVCAAASMNDMSAPSVSLEGKNIWIAQSLPVSAWEALRAKLSVHLILTWIPVLFCDICVLVVLQGSILTSILLLAMTLLYVLLSAQFGLFINLKHPNLTWTREITPIKQSMGVMLSLFGGWAYAAIIAGVFLLLGHHLGGDAYLAVFSVINAVLCILLYRWLKGKGAEIFAHL